VRLVTPLGPQDIEVLKVSYPAPPNQEPSPGRAR
jgi:hypothetical protein